MSAILWPISIWRKLEGWKISISGFLLSWPKIKKKKKSSVWNVVFSYPMQQRWTISWLDCVLWQKVYILQQLGTTSLVVGLWRSSKALPKAKFAPKKDHSHCLVVCSWPLQLSESWVKPLYLRSMLSNSMKVKVLVTQSCPTHCNPMNCSPPGSFLNRILQAKVQQIDMKHWKL